MAHNSTPPSCALYITSIGIRAQALRVEHTSQCEEMKILEEVMANNGDKEHVSEG